MSPEGTGQDREKEANLRGFQVEINRIVDDELKKKEQVEHYDATVVELFDRVVELGEQEMRIWNEFKSFIQSVDETTFAEKKREVDLFLAAIVRARNRYSDGLSMDVSAQDNSLKNKIRHEFYGWIINLFAGLELMEHYDAYGDYEKEVLVGLRQRLHLSD